MVDATTILTFALINLGVALIPGPDVVCTLSNAMTRGARSGILVCAGIACGGLFHVMCAALGLSALLLAVPTAFFVVKTAGAIYLVWLGWRMIRNPPDLSSTKPSGRFTAPFSQGLLSNLLNPKVALFFLSVLPQFIDHNKGSTGQQALILGLVAISANGVINLMVATAGWRARVFIISRQEVLRRFNQLAGCLLIGLGLRVAVDRAR